MAKWGRSPFPRRFGGGMHPLHQEHIAMLEALAPGYDVSEDSTIYPEALAQACAVTAIWIAAKRAQGAMIPTRMLETLPDWEEACRTRPSAKDNVQDRRARVAAKLRGLVGNTLGAMSAALRALLGSRFVQLQTVAPANYRSYWLGINPGPPGYEWSSNRARVAVILNGTGLSGAEYARFRDRASELMASMLPAWMDYRVGTGTSGFIVNQGIVGQTIL